MDKLTSILYSKFLDSLPDGVIVIDTDHRIIAWNTAMEGIACIPREQAIGKGDRFYSLPFFGEPCDMLVDLVLDPDLEKDYLRAFRKHDQNYYGEGWVSVKSRENKIFYWAQASPLFDQAGKLVAAIELLRDNSPMKALDDDWQMANQHADAAFQQLLAVEEEIRQQFEELQLTERNMRRITDNMSDLVSELDQRGNLVFASPSHYKMLGYTVEKMMTLKLKDFVHPEDISMVLDKLKISLDTGQAGTTQHRCQHADGHYIWTETVGNPILHEGKAHGIILSSRDITDRKELEQELRYLSIQDSLTSLYNRTYFEEEMVRLEGGRYNPVGMMIFDLDGLKLVNDTMGHEAGDRLLRITAQILSKCFRTGDVVSRIGGDEFAVLLPETNHLVLEKVADRFQRMIEDYNRASPALPLSVSIGMAVRKDNHSSMRDIYKEADNRMYRIKLQRSASAHSAVVNTLLKALQARDYMTEGHSERMKSLVVSLGKKMGLPESTLANLQLLAQFHDIGKVGIPDRILFKSDGLNMEEYQEMQRHSEIGQRIALASPELSSLADLILKHHEWWDGQGYPFGLIGEQIPLECRIIALADAYDTMTHDRPYRQAVDSQEALAEIKRCSGTQFDPPLTVLFLELLGYVE